MHMPRTVRRIIECLQGSGFEAYAVGGCVRDSLLGLVPHDWDVCTSARPEQMKACFLGMRVIDTGLAHGTLTVLLEGEPIEVTSFRVDEEYQDHRHPKSVRFVSHLREDLARRDFTINAMAVSLDGQLIDHFGGQSDLQNRLVRCVGNPLDRFNEDALRILRALRFASTYDFQIDPQSASAMAERMALLSYVSFERVYQELLRMLRGRAAGRVLQQNAPVLGQVIPELLPAVGFAQHTPYHDADVWTHTARAVQAVEPQDILRLTMLLHDLGKPHCFTRDAKGIGHFYGHAKISERIADEVLLRLRADNRTRARVLMLIRVHDMRLEPSEALLRRRLNAMGEEALWQLISVQRADMLAQSPHGRTEKEARLCATAELLSKMLMQRPCYTLSNLLINGDDLMALGAPEGPHIGWALTALMDAVLDGRLLNERDALLAAARGLIGSDAGKQKH